MEGTIQFNESVGFPFDYNMSNIRMIDFIKQISSKLVQVGFFHQVEPVDEQSLTGGLVRSRNDIFQDSHQVSCALFCFQRWRRSSMLGLGKKYTKDNSTNFTRQRSNSVGLDPENPVSPLWSSWCRVVDIFWTFQCNQRKTSTVDYWARLSNFLTTDHISVSSQQWWKRS